jgi:hypothetical protein
MGREAKEGCTGKENLQEEVKSSISDISDQLTYMEISRQTFMGGSVLYNPAQPSTGHFAPGAHVAVRLGKASRDDKDGVPVHYTFGKKILR